MYASVELRNVVNKVTGERTRIEVVNGDELLSVLETVKLCVEAGELDAQIYAASNAVRARFAK